MNKLLLIDDEDDVRYSFKRIFSSPDLELETAASGEAAVAPKGKSRLHPIAQRRPPRKAP